MSVRLREPLSAADQATHNSHHPARVEPAPSEFEQFLSDFSADLIRASVSEIDAEIERWLERIVLALEVDRGTIVQLDPGDGIFYTTHQWARPGVLTPDRGLRVDYSRAFPWLTARIRTGQILVFSRFQEELPPEASKDIEEARPFGAKSNVTIPLTIGDQVVGAFLAGTVFAERQWSEETLRRLKLIAAILGNAVERIRSEAEIRRLSEELRQVSKVVTMGELTASLAHELNQPLGAILNNATAARRLLAAKKPDLAEIGSALEDIARDDARAVEVVRNVRAMFQRTETTRSVVDLKELLLEVNRIVSADARVKGISLSMTAPDSLPPVWGEKSRLVQVVLNLVSNAFDSVCASDGPRQVELRAEDGEPGAVHMFVRDSGRGIDAKTASRLFEPFFTTKPTGMGMGLSIVRSIIESHGGRIWATQSADRGATLEFTLRAAPNVQSANG